MSAYDTLHDRAHELGLCIGRWSPGDGVTRYRFFASKDHSHLDYFSGDGMFTALGIKEATIFLRGIARGRVLGLTEAEQMVRRHGMTVGS